MTTARTRRALPSSYRPGYEHPAGSEVLLVESLGPDRLDWIVELRVPDESLVGGAWYDHAELHVTDLDFGEELAHDMREADSVAVGVKGSLPFKDTAVALGSRDPPRRAHRDNFLVARCPECGVPWPTYTREDLRLMDHSKDADRTPCEGSGRVLERSEYGEVGDPRFVPPGGVLP